MTQYSSNKRKQPDRGTLQLELLSLSREPGSKADELCLTFKHNSCCLVSLISCLCPNSSSVLDERNMKAQEEGSKWRAPQKRRLGEKPFTPG